MYYNRKISDSFSRLLEPNGELRWLFELVLQRSDLDFLLGKNKVIVKVLAPNYTGANGSKHI